MREEIILMARYKSRKLTAKEYLDFSKKVLLALRPIHPIFRNLCGWGTEAHHWHCFKHDLSDFDEIVLKQIDDKNRAFINEDKNDKNLCLNSYSYSTFSNSYSNTKEVIDGRVTISISDGKEKGLGFINIKFPQVNYPEFNDISFCKNLIEKCIELTHAEYAVILPNSLRENVEKIEGKFWVGSFTYFSRNEIFNLLPKETNKEKLSKGTLFWLFNEKASVVDNNKIDEAIKIKENLEGRFSIIDILS